MAIVGFSFVNCLRHAFFTGAGYGDLEKIKDEDQRRWCLYEPPETGSFKSMSDHFVKYANMQDQVAELKEQLESCVSRLEWFDDKHGAEQPYVKPARALLDKLKEV